jgi:choline transport protein
MAEMASMYPVSGGQYYWVALLAPKRYAKFLSWMTGWLSTLGWQSAASTGTYLGGNIIQALLVLNIPGYEPQRWQGTLIMYAVLALTLLVNTYFVRLLPRLEGAVMILHIVGFFAVLTSHPSAQTPSSGNTSQTSQATTATAPPGSLANPPAQSSSSATTEPATWPKKSSMQL